MKTAFRFLEPKMTLLAGGLSRQWTKNCDIVPLGSRHQTCHVWRGRRCVSGYAGLGDKVGEIASSGHQENSGRLLSFDAKTMGYTTRTETDVAGLKQDGVAINDHRHLTFQDIEGLVFGMMNVPRRLKPDRYDLLDQAELAMRQFSVCLDPGWKAQEVDFVGGSLIKICGLGHGL
jgi:hypothetical protein